MVADLLTTTQHCVHVNASSAGKLTHPCWLGEGLPGPRACERSRPQGWGSSPHQSAPRGSPRRQTLKADFEGTIGRQKVSGCVYIPNSNNLKIWIWIWIVTIIQCERSHTQISNFAFKHLRKDEQAHETV